MTRSKTSAFVLAISLGLASYASFAQETTAKVQTPQPWTYKTKQLKRADIDSLLAQADKVVVIDVRRPDELVTKGGFPVYLSIQAKDLEQNLAYIPKDRAIVTVSNHAHRAGAAGDLLSSKGYKVAGAAGSEDYEAEGGKITRIAAPAQKTAAAN